MSATTMQLEAAFQIREERTSSPPMRPASWAEAFSGSCPAGIGRGAVNLLSCDDVELICCDISEKDAAVLVSSQAHSSSCSGKDTRSSGLRNPRIAARRGSAIIFRSPKSMAEWARKSFLSFRLDPVSRKNSLVNFNEHKSIDIHNEVKSMDFDIFSHSPDQLVEVCMKIFGELDLSFISQENFRNFAMAVKSRMLENPYHNWYHAVDVTQTVYTMASQSGILDIMSDCERLALIVAALCHDLEHPGVTSAFLIKTCSVLAAQYGMDIALLEKHHSSCASQLMTNVAGTGLLDNMEPEARDRTASRVHSLIFATDMSRHGEYMAHIESLLEERARRPQGSPEQRAGGLDEAALPVAAELLLKCADMSNVLKPFSTAKQWAVRITDEFFQQGDLERSMSLDSDVTPTCDRRTQSRVAMQRGFIDFVGPFYRGVGDLLPQLQPALGERLARTREAWEAYDSDATLLAEFGRED